MLHLIDYFIYHQGNNWKECREFPPHSVTDEDGFLAAGGNFDPSLLYKAYHNGIFPWPNEEADLIWWFSPEERFVLYLQEFHIPTSLKRTMRHHDLELRTDTAFREVMTNCAHSLRPICEGEPNSPKYAASWILPQMIDGYEGLFKQGIAHSIEAWQNGELVGGFYGVSVGSIFCGESMFTKVDDASKIALAFFVPIARKAGFQLIDCQVQTNNLARFGARLIPRDTYLEHVNELGQKEIDWNLVKQALQELNHA